MEHLVGIKGFLWRETQYKVFKEVREKIVEDFGWNDK